METTKTFYCNEFQKLRPPTERKIVNAARKAGLYDSMDELVYWLGTYVKEDRLREFAQPEIPHEYRKMRGQLCFCGRPRNHALHPARLNFVVSGSFLGGGYVHLKDIRRTP